MVLQTYVEPTFCLPFPIDLYKCSAQVLWQPASVSSWRQSQYHVDEKTGLIWFWGADGKLSSLRENIHRLWAIFCLIIFTPPVHGKCQSCIIFLKKQKTKTTLVMSDFWMSRFSGSNQSQQVDEVAISDSKRPEWAGTTNCWSLPRISEESDEWVDNTLQAWLWLWRFY